MRLVRFTTAALTIVALSMMVCGCKPSRTPPRPSASVERTSTAPSGGGPPSAPASEPAPAPSRPTTPAVPATSTPPSDTKLRAWYYVPNARYRVPSIPTEARALLRAYGGRYLGPDARLVYLTFDEGYENGNTPKILDALAGAGVRATFFVTASYVRGNAELVRRMVSEGHVVGNHSATHPSMPKIAGDRAAFSAELSAAERAFTQATGTPMARIFRPPGGEYSARSLWLTQQLGYETVFWSFAHRDWDPADQPAVSVTVSRVLGGSHPGAIILLHGVSSSDTKALGAIIAGLREQGYGFGTL